MIKNVNLKGKLEPVQIVTYLLGLTMLLMVTCRDSNFNVGNWFVLPLAIIIVGAYNVIWYIVKNKKMTKFNTTEYCMIFIIFYVLFSSLVLRLPAKFGAVVSYGFLFLLLLVCSLTKFNKEQIAFILKCYIASAVIMSIIIIIQRKTPFPGVMRFSIFFSETEFYEINFLAAYMAVPALVSFNNAMLRKDKHGKTIFYTITSIIVLGIFLTGSRGALIGFMLGALFIICTNCEMMFGKINKIGKPKFKTITIVIVSIVLLYLLLPKELVERFFVSSYNDSSNIKRLQHWNYAIQSFMKQPIFGVGITWTTEVIEGNFGIPYAAHNTFIGALMQLGVVGIIPFMIILINPIKILWENNQKSMIGLILCLIFMMIMIEAQNTLVFFVPLAVIYILVRYSVDERKKIII